MISVKTCHNSCLNTKARNLNYFYGQSAVELIPKFDNFYHDQQLIVLLFFTAKQEYCMVLIPQMKPQTSSKLPQLEVADQGLFASLRFRLYKPCRTGLEEEEMDKHLQRPYWKLLMVTEVEYG